MKRLGIVFSLLYCLSAAAQSPSLKELVARAEQEGRGGNIESARRLITEAHALCPGEQQIDCPAYVNYAAGIAEQQAAAATKDEETRIALLESAVRLYAQSDLTTRTVPALENRARAELTLGRYGDFVETMKSLIAFNPDESAEYRVAAGEVLLEAQKPIEAASYFGAAIKDDPGNADARRGIVQTFVQRKCDDADCLHEMLRFAKQLIQDDYAELAGDAYLHVILTTWKIQEPIALDALIGWVSAYAGALYEVPPVANLPAEWVAAPVAQLRAAAAQPEAARSASWWLKKGKRLKHHALAALLAAHVINSPEMESKRAIAILQYADELAPHPVHYDRKKLNELTGLVSPHFEIVEQLAALYLDTEPDNESYGRGFRRLASGLLTKVLSSLVRGDYTTPQRYHTALGLLLDDRKIWTGYWLNTAEYHLREAVKMNNMRADKDDAEYLPVPDLLNRLAAGLERLEKTEEAATRYLEAASDYLDVDDVVSARFVYDKAVLLRAKDAKLRQEIESVLEMRERLESTSPPDLRFDILRSSPDLARVFEDPEKESVFVRRQRYKMLVGLADLAADKLGVDADDTIRLRLRALRLAKHKDFTAMTSSTDIENLRVLAGHLIDKTPGRSEMQIAPKLSTQFEKAWTYGGGDQFGGFRMGWDDDLLIAADVERVLLEYEPAKRPDFRVDKDHVFLMVLDPGAPELKALTKRIDDLEDVDGVTISTLSANIMTPVVR